LAFPLPASQVREIVQLAEAAPYGLGEKTVLDENVRKCWQVDAAHLSCRDASALIGELLAFLADPAAEAHRFVRSEGERTALADFIRRHSLDLDCITITKGRPYTLACTKNDKSHQHALDRRTQDQALLARLEA
jgi:hypothetical protein